MKRKKIPDSAISSFCMAVSLLLHSGISSGNGLHLLSDEEGDAGFRTILLAMSEKVDDGAPLSAAIRETGAFPAYVSGVAEAGERTGRPEEAFRSLSAYYEWRSQLDTHIRSALLYPSVLLLLMCVVIVVLLAKVLPVFNEVYGSLGSGMTGIAAGLLGFGSALDRAMPALAVLLICAVSFLALFASSDSFRDALMSRGRKRGRGFFRKVGMARFAQGLSMGMMSGLPVEDALNLASSLMDMGPEAGEKYRGCEESIRKGGDLAGALRECGALPPAYCTMLALGIRSGSGDTVMEEIARRLQEESDREIEEKVGRVEPTLVIIASVLVGLILLAVMLPLINIMSAIG